MKTKLMTFALMAFVALGVAMIAPSHEVLAQVTQIQDGIDSIDGDEETASLTDVIRDIIDVLLFLIGAISVVMIIFGGFKYVTSSGESAAVSSAKNTIMYAVIGLVVAISAFVIVNFVTGVFDETDSTPPPYSGGGGQSGVQ